MTDRAPRVLLVLDLARVALGRAGAGRPGVVVQVRDRAATARELVRATRELVDHGVRTIVIDRVDIARAAGAAGVQLPEEGLPVADARALLGRDALGGVSVHVGTRFEERAAGADWALFGPVWPTPGKGDAVGTRTLAEAARRCPCPVLAVGGVDATRARDAIAAGAAGVAVIRAADDLDALLGALV